jgi:hypothetical protein
MVGCPKQALKHGVGRSCVWCHVALLKFAQTSLERAMNHVSGALFVNQHSSDEPMLASFYPPLWLLFVHDDYFAR